MKYQIGQTVWFLKDNKVTSKKITAIRELSDGTIQYSFDKHPDEDSAPKQFAKKFGYEIDLFETKTDLINSL